MIEYNNMVFQFFQGFSSLPFIGLLADVPVFFLPIFLAGMWIFYTYKIGNTHGKNNLLHIFYACVIGIIGSYIIKQFIDIERPEEYLESTKNLIMNRIPEKSFPSDHATVSFAFVTSLFFAGYKKIGTLFLPLVIIMNISRIIVGVHWPLDIIAGSIVGITSSVVFFTYFSELKFVKFLNSFIIKILQYIKL